MTMKDSIEQADLIILSKYSRQTTPVSESCGLISYQSQDIYLKLSTTPINWGNKCI